MSSAKFLIPTSLLLLAAVAARVFAIEDSVVVLHSIRGAGWQASGLRARIEFGATLDAELSIERARIAQLADELRDVRISCPDLRVTAEAFSCAQAMVRGVLPHLGPQRFTASATYLRRDGALQVQASGIAIAKGMARLTAAIDADAWRFNVDLRRAQAAELLALARSFGVEQAFSGTGIVDANLEAGGHGNQSRQFRWDLTAESLTINNPAGTLASEGLTARSRGQAMRDAQGWNFDLELDARAGQGYAEPVFVDFGKQALAAKASGHWQAMTLKLEHFDLRQHEVAQIRGRGTLLLGDTFAAENLHLDIGRLQFPGAYASYLQPFLLNSGFKALQTSGVLRGQLEVAHNAPVAANLELRELSVNDDVSRLSLQNMNGALHWNRQQTDENAAPRSRLSWTGGNLLGLQFGPAELQLQAFGTTVRFAEPARIPIFNGALAVEALRIRKVGTPQVAFMLDANIEPINVAQLCRAFGWPEFGGELSGRITKLRLEDGVLTLGATLNAGIFAGEVAIGNMRLENAFSAWPRFQADISLRNLDLEQVTQAFSFGRITGRLSGEINRLNLFNWEPVSFDARLYTPPEDRSRHRISQRAVQNIGSLGGSGAGVAVALQSGLLKFFEDFNYDRLGISCRLENEVCRMNGVAPAGSGYYLVKGKGLPRIDVIGNAGRVDWPRMLAQLKAATRSSGPVVQ